MNKTQRAWIELFRPPNLFTVPGDVLAGAALGAAGVSMPWTVVPLIIVSLCLYGAGLLFNDYCDRGIDAKERPARPIPSGRVAAGSARTVAILLTGAALLIGGATAAVLHRPLIVVLTFVLAAAVIVYNTTARHAPLAGFLVMGLCRGLNVLLGTAAVVFTARAFAGAGLETAYIMAVTGLAWHETKSLPSSPVRYLPVILLLPLLVLSEGSMAGLLAAFVVVLGAFLIVRAMERDAEHLPHYIGRLIRLLILVQFCFVVIALPDTAAGLASLLVLLLLYTGARYAARHFHGS